MGSVSGGEDYPRSREWRCAKAAVEGYEESLATSALRTQTVTGARILRSLSRSWVVAKSEAAIRSEKRALLLLGGSLVVCSKSPRGQ